MKGITFCLVCGATAPIGAARCPACDAPLKQERERPPGFRFPRPAPLVLLCLLAAIAFAVAIATYLTSRP